MKKLLIAFIVLVGLGTSAMAQVKIAHVDTQKLLDTMPSRIDAMNKLKEFEDNGVQELKDMEANLQKMYANYQEKQGGWTPLLRQLEEEKINKKDTEFQQRQQSLQYEMQMYGNELNQPILDRVQKAIKIVSERRKLNYVFDVSNALYFDGGTDITAEVLVELMILEKEAAAANASTPK